MSPSDLLKEAEADLASLAGLPNEIRDAVEAAIATLTGSAQATLASLQAVATQDADAGKTGAPAANDPPAGPAEPVAPGSGG